MAVNINIPSQVKTYANLAAFPASGSLKTIYIAEDTNKTYRWTGSVYVEISASAAMTWGQIGGTLSNQTDLQNALDAKVPTTRTLTINGTTQDLSANRTFTIPTDLTVGTTPISSGTIGRVLFQGTGNVLQQSSQLSWDNATNALTLTTGKTFSGYNSGGSASDALKLELTNSGAVLGVQNSNASGFSGIEYLSNAGAVRVFTGFNNGNGQEFRFNNVASGGYIDFLIGSTSGLRIANTRNILINTTTDAGFRLDVNGTARVQTSLEIAGATGLTLGGGASALAYSGNILNIGNSASWGDVRLFAGGVQKFSQTSSLTTISNTTINLSTATVQLAGVNALTYSGTDIRIGSVAAGFNSLSMYVAGSERARIASTGNLLINTTTDAGFRLDVNGTARVKGTGTTSATTALTVQNSSNSNLLQMRDDGVMLVRSNDAIRTGVTNSIYYLDLGRIVVRNGDALGGSQMQIGSNLVPVDSAVLDLNSTTRGFLPPRMTTTQKNAIASPATGLQVYDTTLNQMSYYNGTTWTNI
jgi:hypothetical protein